MEGTVSMKFTYDEIAQWMEKYFDTYNKYAQNPETTQRMFDYFTEDTFDFCYKERSIANYKNDIGYFLEDLEADETSEEDKLLKKSFENKKVIEVTFKERISANVRSFKNDLNNY